MGSLKRVLKEEMGESDLRADVPAGEPCEFDDQ